MYESRRARPVLIGLVILAIALITLDFRASGDSAAHQAGSGFFGPVERMFGSVVNPVVNVFHATAGNDSTEISNLQKQNDALRAQLAQSQVTSQEQQQLAKTLHLSASHGYKVVAASVIAVGGGYSDTITISAGRGSGITTDETVLNGDGLVGVVTATTSDTATVQLATDAASTVGVRLAANGQIGAITGAGNSLAGPGTLQLKLFDATAVLRPGQQVVTFGSVGGRPYVPGVPVGVVTSVTTSPGSLTPTANVRPYVDFTGLGVVAVVVSK